jgi:hypothetical protein
VDIFDTDLILWEEAQAVGGNYFVRARELGLPLPPRAFVYHLNNELTVEQMKLIGDYHDKFMKAETRKRIFPSG